MLKLLHRLLSSSAVHRLVLFIDETGKARGHHLLSALHYDASQFDLVCVQPDANPPVYRLLARGLAYRKAREAHAAAVTLRRIQKLKQVHFRPSMASHDYRVHLERAREFLGRHGWRVRVVVEKGKGARPLDVKKSGEEYAAGIVEELRGEAVQEGPLEFTDNTCSFYLKPVQK